jgi:hypothetical protein
MSKKLSIAAICVGLLCTGLCGGAYYSQQQDRPGAEPEPIFWELMGCGLTLLALGVRGLFGRSTAKTPPLE